MQDFSLYFTLGWDHIIDIGALDHIYFIIALTAIYTFKEWRKVLVLVTAFTVGHSITLALMAYDFVHISTKWIEFLIPCTIVITALSNLFRVNGYSHKQRLNYVFALFFGLIHGLGFAIGLRSMMGRKGNILPSLFGFNIGLEVGQVVIVAVILFFSFVFLSIIKLPRKIWVVSLSAAVFALALKMAIERIPFH